MAYTYDEFVNSATKSGVMGQFSKEDLAAAQKNPEYGLSMVSLMKDAGGAKTPEQRILATEAANQLRKNYGVSTGSFGQLGSNGYQINGGTAKQNTSYPTGGNYQSQIQNLMGQLDSYGPYSYEQQDQLKQLMNQVGNYGSFEYSKQDQLAEMLDKVNNYGEFSYGNETIYQQLLNGLINQEAFQYDHTQDPSYSAYKKAYLREGERAGANALAQAAAASGGIPSSYALQAAQQANNYYAGQLADVIPALEQQAYQRYQGDIANRMNNLNVLQADRAQAQNDWQSQYAILQNALANLQNDRTMEQGDWQTQYNMLLNSLGNLQSERNFGYQAYLDQFGQMQTLLDNYRNQDAADYNRFMDQLQLKRADEQTAYERALDQYQILGYITPEMSEILGIPATELPKETTPTTPGGPGSAADEGLGDTPLDGNPDNNDMITQLKGLYPGGAVPDATTWSYLAAMYGEDVLQAAGLYYRENKPNSTPGGGKPGVVKTPVALTQ